MYHRRTIRKTTLDVVWLCSCGWITWQRRALKPLARNAKLMKAWRKHLTKTGAKEGRR